jgi:hypothetical protein
VVELLRLQRQLLQHVHHRRLAAASYRRQRRQPRRDHEPVEHERVHRPQGNRHRLVRLQFEVHERPHDVAEQVEEFLILRRVVRRWWRHWCCFANIVRVLPASSIRPGLKQLGQVVPGLLVVRQVFTERVPGGLAFAGIGRAEHPMQLDQSRTPFRIGLLLGRHRRFFFSAFFASASACVASTISK